MRYRNEGLFSNHFLETRLRDMADWRGLAPDPALRARMNEILEAARPGLPGANEPQTENDLIRPLLDELRVPFDVQTAIAAWAGRRVPDYAIFPSSAARVAALPLRGQAGFWEHACAVADAKAWSTGLDDPGAGGGGRTPAQQLTEYMRDADHKWGVLTNGRTWRLYTRHRSRRATDYFEMELEHAVYGEDDEFKLFYLVFGPAGLVPAVEDARTFNDRLLEGSVTYARGIGERLRDRAFRTVELLARGFVQHESWSSPNREQLNSVYESSLVLLYRLLFILSAEARRLLPIDHPTYREYSLLRLRDEVRARRAADSLAEASCDFYGRLVNLFTLIDQGAPAMGVPPYNGGLFDPNEHPFLRDSCCRDPQLGEAVYQLAYDVAPDSGLEETIDYRDIAPRHLGTIYEGLLEFRLTLAEQPLGIARRDGVEVYVPESPRRPAVVQSGDLYLHNDKGERRATGSYYTPDYVVDYIVAHALNDTLSAKAAEVEAQLAEFFEEQLEDAERAQTIQDGRYPYGSIADKLMDVRVLDPSMGSGHFLVGAMHYIAEAVYTNPHYQATDEDPHGVLLRRRIAERCLFGVDFNPLAVELARLTLWLETVAPDRPLSFLDHHLKGGNSLLGASLAEVGQLSPAPPGQVSLAEHEFERDLPQVMGELVAIAARDARTHEDVEEKLEHASRAGAFLDPYRRVADYWLAVAGFRGDGDQSLLDSALMGIRDESQRQAAESDPRWERALEFGRQLQFFHWEIEFPEAFFDTEGNRLENPGFDAVIGNPPYEVLETRRSDFQDADGNWTPDGRGRYERRRQELDALRRYFRRGRFPNATSGGKLDFYRLFVERAVNLTPRGGAIGMIVPRSLLGDEWATGVRKLLWSETRMDPVEVFPKDPPACWVFPEAELAVVVFVAQREMPGMLRVRRQDCRLIENVHPFAGVSREDSQLLDAETEPIPLVGPEDLTIVRAVYASPHTVRFKDVSPCHIGEINSEYGREYMSDTDTGTLLVRGRHIGRYLLDERSVDPSKRWIDEASYVASLEHPDNRPALRPRIAKQAITDLNDPRRIIAALCPAGHYLLDSCDYLAPPGPYRPEYVLAILLSDVAEWRFRMTSSNNNVNAYEIDQLPFPRIADWDEPNRSERGLQLLSDIREAMTEGAGAVRTATSVSLDSGGPRSAVHDAIVGLVAELSDARRDALADLDTFRLVLRSLEGGNRLTDNLVDGEWVALEEEEFFAQLASQGVELTAAALARVRDDRNQVLGRLRGAIRGADQLDGVVNEICYVLFGLDPDQRNVISASLPEVPAFLPGLGYLPDGLTVATLWH